MKSTIGGLRMWRIGSRVSKWMVSLHDCCVIHHIPVVQSIVAGDPSLRLKCGYARDDAAN
jgi:hypothetical protein